MFLTYLNTEIVACILLLLLLLLLLLIIIIIILQKIAPQAESVLPNMVFPLIWGKNGGVLSMRMQAILDSVFVRPGSAPIGGGKKGEFRDWTIVTCNHLHFCMESPPAGRVCTISQV